MRLLLLLASTLAIARPAPKKAPDVPAPAEADDPGPGPSPIRPPAPPLTGPTSGFDLVGLTRKATTFRFEVDTGGLAVDGPAAERLLRHLAADPRWRVVDDGGTIAVRRAEIDGAGWTADPTGYVIGEDACRRVALHAGPPTGDWATSPQVARVAAGAGELPLVVFATEAAPCRKQAATAVVIQGPHLALSIYESGDGRARPSTLEALASTLDLVAHVGVAAEAVDARGHDPFSMPEGEPPALVEPTVTLTSPGPGLLRWSARVDPAAGGWTWLRLLDGALIPWAPEAVGRGTRERSGWSDGTRGFLVESVFAVPPGPAFSATAEIWFQPDEGGTPLLLTAVPVDVPAR